MWSESWRFVLSFLEKVPSSQAATVWMRARTARTISRAKFQRMMMLVVCWFGVGVGMEERKRSRKRTRGDNKLRECELGERLQGRCTPLIGRFESQLELEARHVITH